jgi:archaemetzincin
MGLLRPPGDSITREDRVKLVTAPGRYDAKPYERLDKLPKKKRDEFLALVPEPGQTAEEFASEEKDRLPSHRRAIRFYSYVPNVLDVPDAPGAGAPTGALLSALCAFVEAVFPGTTGEVGPVRPLPEEFFDDEGGQVEAERVLDDLLELVSVDALAVLGLSGSPLFSGPRDELGGLSSFRRRVTVLSVPFHAEGADDARFLRRLFGAVAHDVGHVLGMAHCVFFRCVMNGVATDDAIDLRPIQFCPVCEEKIGFALAGGRGDWRAASRKKLRALFREHGLVAEAEFVERLRG